MGVSEKAIISGEDILAYIPQRSPIIMVDSYFGRDEASFYTGLTPDIGSIFSENGLFTEPGIIEHMAQSAAVAAGIDLTERGMDIPVGFIGAVSKLRIERLPMVHKALRSTITEIQKFQGISLVTVRVECEGVTIAEGELKIFLSSSNNNDN